MARIGAVLDVRPVTRAIEPGPENGASGALPPRDVLTRPGEAEPARGKPVPGRAAVSPRVAEVVPIVHGPAVRLGDGGDATVPDERREPPRDSMRVHQFDERDDLAVGRSGGGRGSADMLC